MTKAIKALLYIVPFTVIVFTPNLYYPYVTGKAFFFRLIIEAALLLLFMAYAQAAPLAFKKALRSPLTIPIGIFLGITLIATIFGIDPSLSFWGSFERSEGVFQLLHYGALYFMLLMFFTEFSDWKKLFIYSFITGIITLIGVQFTSLFFDHIDPSIVMKDGRFIGTLGNATYVGIYFMFMIGYIAILFSDTVASRAARSTQGMLIGLAIISLAFIVFSQTRSAMLGLVAGTVAAIAFLLFRGDRKTRKISMIGLSIIITGAILVGAAGTMLPEKYCSLCHRFANLSPSAGANQPRLWIWQTALEGAKERPILGWGSESFYAVFNQNFDTRHFNPNATTSETRIDRVHNIFLQYLVDTGILGLLSFLAIFGTLYFHLLKRKIKELPIQLVYTAASLIGLSVAFLVAGFFSVESISMMIHLFIFLAFSSWFIETHIRTKQTS
jgi:O-antigen ligase